MNLGEFRLFLRCNILKEKLNLYQNSYFAFCKTWWEEEIIAVYMVPNVEEAEYDFYWVVGGWKIGHI